MNEKAKMGWQAVNYGMTLNNHLAISMKSKLQSLPCFSGRLESFQVASCCAEKRATFIEWIASNPSSQATLKTSECYARVEHYAFSLHIYCCRR